MMKINRLHIPIFEEDFIFIQIEDKNDANKVGRVLKNNKLDAESISSVVEDIKDEYINWGHTLYNMLYWKFIIVIGECPKEIDKVSVISHEVRHLVDRILEHTRVDDNEASAYLTAYIYRWLYKIGVIKTK